MGWSCQCDKKNHKIKKSFSVPGHNHLNLVFSDLMLNLLGTLRLIQGFSEVKNFYNTAQMLCAFLPIVSTKVPGGWNFWYLNINQDFDTKLFL